MCIFIFSFLFGVSLDNLVKGDVKVIEEELHKSNFLSGSILFRY